MEGPTEFADAPTATDSSVPTIHTVRNHEVGFLDELAFNYYGPGYERLWWTIALANAMIDPEHEMYTGQRLVIPARATISRFLSRAGDAVASA